VKIAFTHAFHHLRQATPYEDALIEVLSGGGDTDTNACIVGGLSGALHGFNDLPHEMVQALVNCNTQLGRPRPQWLTTNDLISLADGLSRPLAE